jgi:hypothetical protein
LVPGGGFVMAGPFGGRGLGAGPGRGQPGFPGAGADLAELVTDPLRRPGCFDGVGIAQVQQAPVRHAADVRAASSAAANTADISELAVSIAWAISGCKASAPATGPGLLAVSA